MINTRVVERERTHRNAVGPVHHGSHRQLLDALPETREQLRKLDAVVVPASRTMNSSFLAPEVARDLDCVLTVLCSKSADPNEASYLGAAAGAATIALDLKAIEGVLPAFQTASLLAGTTFASSSDLSSKRNLGLMLAKAAGWENVLFLDDDVSVPDARHVEVAAGSLDCYRAVGFHNTGFPDNSIVCRVNREIGGEQEQFIGAGALVLSPTSSRSFFPDIYCEDWFYLLGEGEPLQVAVLGEVVHQAYDPYADPDRAQREELGDTLAEGLYCLLDEGVAEQSVLDRADADFWTEFLGRRRAFILDLLTKLHDHAGDRRTVSLNIALDVNAQITPEMCVRYLDAWRADLEMWRRFMGQIEASGNGIEGALDRLGIAGAAYRP